MAFLTVTSEVFLILDVATLLGKGNTDMAFQHVDCFFTGSSIFNDKFITF